MGAKSTVMAAEWLDHYFLNSAMAGIGDAGGLLPSAVAGSIYISAHTADPGDGGDQNTNEASFTGYARVTKTRSGTDWERTGGSTQVVHNKTTIAFPTNTGTAEVITHICYGDDVSGAGKIRYILELASTIVVVNGMAMTFIAGELTLEEN
jgi:hypothetical protein